jgi:hypothetical protein
MVAVGGKKAIIHVQLFFIIAVINNTEYRKNSRKTASETYNK